MAIVFSIKLHWIFSIAKKQNKKQNKKTLEMILMEKCIRNYLS